MSKITKKQLHNGWHCHDTEIIKMKKELRELKQSVLRLEKLTDEKLLDEPQLKQLDQSVFDRLDEKWRFAAVDSDGVASYYDGIPEIRKDHFIYLDAPNGAGQSYRLSGIYDASNWQNSLIERDTAKELLEVDLSSELTGSDLARAMLERGDKFVMCAVSDDGEEDTLLDGYYVAVSSIGVWGVFETYDHNWLHATPINNQGEPLTAREVGL